MADLPSLAPTYRYLHDQSPSVSDVTWVGNAPPPDAVERALKLDTAMKRDAGVMESDSYSGADPCSDDQHNMDDDGLGKHLSAN